MPPCGMSEYWDIEAGPVDSARFFLALPTHFAEATVFFAEGTSIAPDVLECFERYTQHGEYLPGRNTIWPASTKLRCAFAPALFSELGALAARHAEPELLDHLFVYAGEIPLLEWHDAFGNAMLLSGNLPEERVAAFASHIGLPYGKARFRKSSESSE